MPARSFFAFLLVLAAPCLAQMGPVAVSVAPVEQRSVEVTQPLVATIEPVTRSTLATEEAWLVAERSFDEGQRVEKGALLARGQSDLVRAQRDAAEGRRLSAVAELEKSKVELAEAERELERVQQLANTRVGSVKELADAKTRVGTARADIAVKEAQIGVEAAEVQRLDLLVKKADVYAPMAGVISRRYVEVGQWLDKGDAVADLVQLDPLYVRVNVPEATIARVRIGDQARVTINALPGRELSGKISQILPEADAASRTFAVRVLLPNPDLLVMPGFFAQVTLTLPSVDGGGRGFVAPLDALVRQGTSAHVVAARDGKAIVVPVAVGTSAGDRVIVQGELRPDDQLVTRGNESLRGGEPLMITGGPPPSGGAEPAN